MSPNPISYAESTLDVHGVYARAQLAFDQIREMRTALVDATAVVRDRRSALADAEAETISNARAERADLSDTAFQRELKLILQRSPEMKKAKERLDASLVEQDGIEAELKVAERALDLETARMHELAGLLVFYGAATQRRKPA